MKFSELRSVWNKVLALPRLPPASPPTVLRPSVLQSVKQKIFRRFFAGTRLVGWKDHGNLGKSPSKEEKLLMIFSDEEIMVSFFKLIFPPQDSRSHRLKLLISIEVGAEKLFLNNNLNFKIFLNCN